MDGLLEFQVIPFGLWMISTMSFSYCFMMSQNKMAMGTLYREPLGEIVAHYDNVYKIKKRLR